MKITGLLFGLIGAFTFSHAEITPLHCGGCDGDAKEQCEDKKDCDKKEGCSKKKKCCGECQEEKKEA